MAKSPRAWSCLSSRPRAASFQNIRNAEAAPDLNMLTARDDYLAFLRCEMPQRQKAAAVQNWFARGQQSSRRPVARARRLLALRSKQIRATCESEETRDDDK
jgi:hypothetical protein